MSLTPKQFTVTVAGEYSQATKIPGHFMRVVAATGTLMFRFDGRDEISYKPGETRFTPTKWNTVEVKSTVAETVECVIGTDPQDRETTAPVMAATVSSDQWSDTPANCSVYGAVAPNYAVAVCPAGVRPRSIVISASPHNSGPIFVGDISSTPVPKPVGTALMPGQTERFFTCDILGGAFREMVINNLAPISQYYSTRWEF